MARTSSGRRRENFTLNWVIEGFYRKDKRITIATNLEWGVRTFQLNHTNLECLKQMPQKPGDLKREDFQNMCQIKPEKQIIFVMIFFTSIGQWVAK